MRIFLLQLRPEAIVLAVLACLRQQGHDVTVLDRQAKPAAETSHANGGQISVSHAEPGLILRPAESSPLAI